MCAHINILSGKRWDDQWELLQATTGGTIFPVLCSSDGISSIPLMHALHTPYKMQVTCHPLSASCLLHRSPAFVMDSLTVSADNVSGLWEKQRCYMHIQYPPRGAYPNSQVIPLIPVYAGRATPLNAGCFCNTCTNRLTRRK